MLQIIFCESVLRTGTTVLLFTVHCEGSSVVTGGPNIWQKSYGGHKVYSQETNNCVMLIRHCSAGTLCQ